MHICDDLVAFRLSEMLKLHISIFMLDDVFKWVEIENRILKGFGQICPAILVSAKGRSIKMNSIVLGFRITVFKVLATV